MEKTCTKIEHFGDHEPPRKKNKTTTQNYYKKVIFFQIIDTILTSLRDMLTFKIMNLLSYSTTTSYSSFHMQHAESVKNICITPYFEIQ